MNDLVSKGIPKSRSAYLADNAKSMIYYERRKRKPKYYTYLEKRIYSIVDEEPSYGTNDVTAMIHRSRIKVEKYGILILFVICPKAR